MPTFENMKAMAEELKEFIRERPEFNQAGIAKAIEWHPVSMHKWMKGERPIPEKYIKPLEKVLMKYGYSKNVFNAGDSKQPVNTKPDVWG